MVKTDKLSYICRETINKKAMPTIETIRDEYCIRADRARQALNAVQRQISRTSLLRLLFFVAGLAGVATFHEEGWIILAGIILVTVLPFILLIKRHNRLFRQKAYLEQEIEVNRQELAALEHDTSAFDDGEAFIDPAHRYSLDLDLFGPRSLFQYINRTCTDPGRRLLAEWLNNHLEEKEEIERRQEAVRELAPELDFRQRFRILGLLHKGKAADENELRAWAESPTIFRRHRLLHYLPPLATATNALCLLLVVANILPGSLWAILWVGFVTVGFFFTGKVTRMQAMYGKKLRILGTYAQLLQQIEEQPMRCALLQEMKEGIGDGRQNASQSIRRLNQLMHELDQRNNMLMYAVLNGLFLWELRQILRIEGWKEQHAARLGDWLTALKQVDALCSLATFAYNHPDYTYPTLLPRTAPNSKILLQGEALGHPLMPRDRCVRNDIDLPSRPYFLIITGANMAGKSTYLRTVGINYLLACIGAPVCARRLELCPVRLITSLRTSDSLNDNESYFFAELKRLKQIIDRLQKGEELFIILDEILKGTNSLDKQKGSFALIRQLMHLRANGIIATHDLLLGTLTDLFPQEIRDHCFEADIHGDELTFSYRLRPGVAQNMNACFLMKKMGIAVAD